jgi:hypothetical protein
VIVKFKSQGNLKLIFLLVITYQDIVYILDKFFDHVKSLYPDILSLCSIY